MRNILGYDSKFLESTDNLKRVLKESLGLDINSTVATGATVCLQHGRLYFEAAEKSPLEIKPLLIFYGIMNYAKALVIARNLMKIEALPRSHGLNDKSSQTSKLEELTVKMGKEGTFQQFNDSVRKLDCIDYKNGRLNRYDYITIPTAESRLLINREFTLKDILSRICCLEHLYSETFCEESKTTYCGISYENEAWGFAQLRIEDRNVIDNSESRKHIIDKLKRRHPFLENWCLIEAQGNVDHSVLTFANFDKSSATKIYSNVYEQENGNYSVGPFGMGFKTKEYKCVNFWDIIQPIGGGLTNGSYLIEPFDGTCISELSLYYLGMYLLSSLVRYRPQIWMHSLSRLSIINLPSDDAALALIEKFLEETLNVFPSAIVKAMSMEPKTPPSV
jgi:hypothetical protein